jgi:hypothetical protein
MKKQHHNIEFFKKVLEEVFLDYKKKLRVNKEWKFRLQVGKSRDLFAEVVYDYKAREFTVYVNETKHATIRSLEDSVIHEFWHVLLTPYTARVDALLDEAAKGKVTGITRKRKAFKNEEEQLVRKFTRIIVDLERNRKNLEKQARLLKKESSG